MKRVISSFNFGLFCLFCVPGLMANIIRIPADFPTIQQGIDATVNGDTILIADGIYQGSGNKNISFDGKRILVTSENGPEDCIIECGNSGRGFSFHSYETPVSVLRGMTIRNGFLDQGAAGGGIYCVDSTGPTIDNCIILNCSANRGGGIAVFNSSPDIQYCILENNTADFDGGGLYLSFSNSVLYELIIQNNHAGFHGGGLYVSKNSDIWIEDSSLLDNTAVSGGGLSVLKHTRTELKDCYLSSNKAINGGGLYVNDSFLGLRSSHLELNTARRGGGVFFGHRSNSGIENNVFADNHADQYGGGIFVSNNCQPDIFTSLIFMNTAEKGGGIYLEAGAKPQIFLCNIDHNQAAVTGGGIHVEYNDQPYLRIGNNGMGNRFDSNVAGGGADIFSNQSDYTIRLRYNTFAGNHLSNFFVSPQDHFRDDDNVSETELINSDLYVSTSGSDENQGTSADSPFQTIHHALSVMNHQSYPKTIYLEPGTYSPSVTGEQFPLSLQNFVTIQGSDSGSTVIDAEKTGSVFAGVDVVNCNLFDLTITGGLANKGGGLYCQDLDVDLSSCRIIHNHARETGGGIFASSTYSSQLPEVGGYPQDSCVFSKNSSGNGTGADLSAETYTIIYARYNQFDGDYLDPFYVYPQVNFDLSHSETDFSPINQDVYVSVNGNDSNDGLSPDTAFKTIQHALRQAEGSLENLVTIHVGPGLYSPSATGETFPIHLDDVSLIYGARKELTILDAEGSSGIFKGSDISAAILADMTLQGGKSETGGAASLDNTIILIQDCSLTGNHARLGGAIYIRQGQLYILDSEFVENLTEGAYTAGGAIYAQDTPIEMIRTLFAVNNADYGGAVFNDFGSIRMAASTVKNNQSVYGGGIYSSPADLEAISCFFTNNSAALFGGGLYLWGGQPTNLINCTIAQNIAQWMGGGLMADSARECVLRNSILWGDKAVDGEEIALVSIPQNGSSDVTVEYCAVQGGEAEVFVETPDVLTWGSGNFDDDPLFVTGPAGNYYLSQTESGQQADSVCVDSGNANSNEIGFDFLLETKMMSQFTTRTDQVFDSEIVDLGGHYTEYQEPAPTPTPEPTFTPTPPLTLGVDLEISQTLFHEGDPFVLDAFISNPGPLTYPDSPFVVILDVYSLYFFYPDWTDNFNYEIFEVDVGRIEKTILDFTWPDVQGSVDGVKIYGALLTPGFSDIIGDWDMVSFGWSEF